jgi:signal transduction histidine kinase
MGIAYGLQIMSEQNVVSAENRRFLDMALGATQELTEMVSAMLDLRRMESQQMPLRRETCDLVVLAETVLHRITHIATYRVVQVRISGAPTPTVVDRELIERVFANLLTNAIKFSPARSQITVTISKTPNVVRVEVADQGPGIPLEYHQRVFEKFGQVENRFENRKYSTGLGLAFCKMAVEMHGGRIGVKSEPGKGSTFWFELPTGI